MRGVSCRIFIIFFGFLFVSLSMASGYEKGVHYRVVYFNPDVTIEDPVTAVSAMKPFTDYLGKKLGIVFEPFFFKKQTDVVKFLETHPVGFGIFSQMFIVENYRTMNFEPIAIALKEGQPYYRKVILVRKDSPFVNLDDLRGKSLATTSLGEDNIPFLNKVVFREEIDVMTHFGEMKIVDSANSAIMAVLYKEADAAAANYLNFVFLKELNPQVDQQLKSIFNSAQTPLPGLVYFREHVPQDLVERARQEMLTMHESPLGQQTMLAFQVEAWGPATIDTWKETAKLLNISLTDKPTESDPQVVPTPLKEKPVPDAAPTATPEQQVLKKEIVFSKITAHPVTEANVVRVSAQLVARNTAVDASKISVSYTISSGDKGTISLTETNPGNYEGSIPLPIRQGTGGTQEKQTYTVRPGDTLGKIAKKFLGDSRKYMLIATLNDIKDPHIIQAGAELIIMSGAYTGFDINYSVIAHDTDGVVFTSKSRFVSVS